MEHRKDKDVLRGRIRARIRKKVNGTADKPRLAVFKSYRHIYVQAVDDTVGKTIAAASTRDAAIREKASASGNITAAKAVGTTIAERLKKIGKVTVVFDRGGSLYHGRVKALADAAREGGLKF